MSAAHDLDSDVEMLSLRAERARLSLRSAKNGFRQKLAAWELQRLQTTPSILIVDDHEAWRRSAAREFATLGKVTCVGSGEEAIALTEAEAFDLIVMDLHLPGITGMETIELLRKRSLLLPILVVTGQVDQTSAARIARMAGANAVVMKPASVSELVETARKIMD